MGFKEVMMEWTEEWDQEIMQVIQLNVLKQV